MDKNFPKITDAECWYWRILLILTHFKVERFVESRKIAWTNDLWVIFGYSPYFIWLYWKIKHFLGFSLQYSSHKQKTYHLDLNPLCWHTTDTFISMHKHEVMTTDQCISFYCWRRINKNPGDVCWGGTILVDWLGTWHSVRISASLSCSQCAADWLSAVDLITLRLLAVTLWWEADASKPRGSICMSGRAWTVHVSEAPLVIMCSNIPFSEKASSKLHHWVTVFHILLWEAGIHQPDQMCQHVTYHSSGSSPASTRFALNATLYDVKEKIQPWRLIWPEDKAAVGKCDGLILKQG